MKYNWIALMPLLAACGSEEPKAPVKTPITQEQVNNLSGEMGKWDATRQKDEIEAYIKNHNWEMSQTGTGLYYMYISKGTGKTNPADGQMVKVAYAVYLLDGTLCYSSQEKGPREVKVGQDYVESGLHEGLKLMKTGDKMRFILPSHLAHGLTGDDDKIPPRASVLYEIELLEIR